MLPRFLAALKTEGFHVVRMVPGGTATATRDAPPGWSSETERTLARRMGPKGRTAAASLFLGGQRAVEDPAGPADAFPMRGTSDQ